MTSMPANTPLHRIFCSNLRARRNELGLTQVRVAKRLGVTQPTYATLEGGKSAPTLTMLEKIAVALETTPKNLLTTDDTAVATG
jgi:transcriptional regulator with XRE-family HTH domain